MSFGLVSATVPFTATEILKVEKPNLIFSFYTRSVCMSGLDKIYELTNTPTQYELRFDLGVGSERAYAVYDNFKIAPVKQKFKLTVGKYSGTAGGL